MKSKTSKIVLFAVLIALASALSYFDGYISSIISLGTVKYKLGFANIVIMLILYNYDFKSIFLAVMIKSLIVGLLLGGGIITFVISICGSTISVIGMYLFKKMLLKRDFMPFIGLIGGFLHPIGQFIGAILIYGFKEFLASSLISVPIMLIMGIITGFVVGKTAKVIDKILKNKFN
jgi:heptaprenyl diphosphate synthase